MSKIDCGIAQDLMPLVIDEIASPESREALDGHLADCESCRHVYALMSRRLPAPETPAAEDTAFIRFCRRMEKNFSVRRLVLWLLVGGLLGCLLALGIYVTYHNVFTDGREMPGSWYDAALMRRDDGSLLCEYVMLNGHSDHNFGSGGTGYPKEGIYYISPLKPVWEIGWYAENRTHFVNDLDLHDFRWEDGKIVVLEADPDSLTTDDSGYNYYYQKYDRIPVKEIRVGTEKDYRVLWREGGEVPLIPAAADAGESEPEAVLPDPAEE